MTSDYCVDETLTLLVARKRPKLALAADRVFFGEELARLHFLTASQVQRAWIAFQTKHAAGWSFTDCTSKIVIEDLGVRTVVALDKHLRQLAIAIAP